MYHDTCINLIRREFNVLVVSLYIERVLQSRKASQNTVNWIRGKNVQNFLIITKNWTFEQKNYYQTLSLPENLSLVSAELCAIARANVTVNSKQRTNSHSASLRGPIIFRMGPAMAKKSVYKHCFCYLNVLKPIVLWLAY